MLKRIGRAGLNRATNIMNILIQHLFDRQRMIAFDPYRKFGVTGLKVGFGNTF